MNDQQEKMSYLIDVANKHKIWKNPLLTACSNLELSFQDFQFIFSQYYLYSKNFTKLLAIGMLKCDDDYYRSKLSKNIWEEGGGEEVELRHAEIFRKFLSHSLKLNLDNNKYETYTHCFVDQYIDLCLHAEAGECAAILAFGTEGIVARLYNIFRDGLFHVNLKEKDIEFFTIHIECDDDHAYTLAEQCLSYGNEQHWFERCESAINRALDLRDKFFHQLYDSLQMRKIASLIETIKVCPTHSSSNNNELVIKQNINATESRLYQNQDLEKKINFTVDRIALSTDVLDPRLVHIPVGFSNEFHRHAHETVFLILAGQGEVQIDDQTIKVTAGDVILVPRWMMHQTRNTGDTVLTFFAVTDYGLTRRFPQNTENSYRLNKKWQSEQGVV